ncbi:MAG: 4Fe-4S dicluster domain-containing protein [Candidatus Aenigmarchaeota archaeon]|nr:4Fe-4S dicluster domain-containing protein [Candidatus Aenigmarchaeota archaeon]NIQ18075.1 4Fe-4S dicluster domain-containing protein [Candidatus Aenigmarchaeota archaeon]
MERKISKAGVTSKPTIGLKKSGWRTFRPIITENCKGCGICVTHCPEGCMKIEKKKAKVDYDYCKGCLICANVCPFKAVKNEMEK